MVISFSRPGMMTGVGAAFKTNSKYAMITQGVFAKKCLK